MPTPAVTQTGYVTARQKVTGRTGYVSGDTTYDELPDKIIEARGGVISGGDTYFRRIWLIPPPIPEPPEPWTLAGYLASRYPPPGPTGHLAGDPRHVRTYSRDVPAPLRGGLVAAGRAAFGFLDTSQRDLDSAGALVTGGTGAIVRWNVQTGALQARAGAITGGSAGIVRHHALRAVPPAAGGTLAGGQAPLLEGFVGREIINPMGGSITGATAAFARAFARYVSPTGGTRSGSTASLDRHHAAREMPAAQEGGATTGGTSRWWRILPHFVRPRHLII